ncbi:MAG: hypothetical protein HYZ50_05705 [Deltaproteobacteria bacterium]|nr:hypothetical protein [Deltaproteobacteria bacterium]
MENHHVVVLIVEDQPTTARPLGRALNARGYRVIVTCTVRDLVICLEARALGGLIVFILTLSVTDASSVFRTHRCWGTRVPGVLIAPLSVPIAFRRAVQEGGGRVLPLSTSVAVLYQAVEIAAYHKQEKRR